MTLFDLHKYFDEDSALRECLLELSPILYSVLSQQQYPEEKIVCVDKEILALLKSVWREKNYYLQDIKRLDKVNESFEFPKPDLDKIKKIY